MHDPVPGRAVPQGADAKAGIPPFHFHFLRVHPLRVTPERQPGAWAGVSKALSPL